MTFKESYKKLTKDGKKIIDQLDGTNDAESAEKIADQYSKLVKSERLLINKMYEYVVMEIDYITDILKIWDSSIQSNNLKRSLIAQRKLLDKGYIPKLRYTIDDALKATYQEVLGYKNYLDFSRTDYALMGLAFISNLQGNNISGGNIGNTGGTQIGTQIGTQNNTTYNIRNTNI